MFFIVIIWNGEFVDYSFVELKVSFENEILVRVNVVGFLFNDLGFLVVILGSFCFELWEYEG